MATTCWQHASLMQLIYVYYMAVVILQDQLKDFLDKKERGELMIQKTSNLLKTVLKEVQQLVYLLRAEWGPLMTSPFVL